MKRAAFFFGFIVVVTTAAEARADGPCPTHLFIVARNKNGNIVAYDANRTPEGGLAADKAVVAYWLLDGDPARREDLNAIEWNRAYGFDLKKGAENGTQMLVFKAGSNRPLTIKIVGGCAQAVGKISGEPAILRKIFIQAKEGGLRPSVETVEFYGEDPGTGQAVYEKFQPGK
jgi:hypothetical protein